MSHRSLKLGMFLAALALAAVPALAAEEDKPQTAVDASKGGFTVKSGDNSLTFGAYAQIRVVGQDRELGDQDPEGSSGFGAEDGWSNSFDVTRVRLSIRGTMYRPWLKYVVAYELGRTSGENSSKIKDAYLEFAKNPMAAVRVGQYKVPFSLQELVGDQYQQFVERSITNVLAVSRDTGVGLQGVTEKKAFGYQVGVFNGSGESVRQEDQGLLYAARVWFDPFGEYQLREGSNERPDRHLLHVGLAWRGGEAARGGDTFEDVDGDDVRIFEDPDDQTALNVELGWKWKALFATGEYFTVTTERQNPLPGQSDVDSDGWHLQGGFTAVPDKLEVGVRYATVDADNDVSDDAVTEARVGLNWFWKSHNLKLQSDVGQVEYEANAPGRGSRLASAAGQTVKDTQLRIQFQLNF